MGWLVGSQEFVVWCNGAEGADLVPKFVRHIGSVSICQTLRMILRVAGDGFMKPERYGAFGMGAISEAVIDETICPGGLWSSLPSGSDDGDSLPGIHHCVVNKLLARCFIKDKATTTASSGQAQASEQESDVHNNIAEVRRMVSYFLEGYL